MSRILRFNGLPFKILAGQIKDWIEEKSQVVAKDVILITNRQGLASGDAYVVFEDKAMAKTVFETCDEKTIGDSNRYVKMHECDEDELNWHISRQKLFQDNQELYCVRMYGLPFRASEYQVASWFGDANANCVDVQFHLNHQGKKSGDATAFFTSPEEAKKGVGKDKHDMNGRYINLTLDSAAATFGGAAAQISEFCLKMSGLPFRATEQEMKEFFLPEAKCKDVKVILNKDGRPSGDAIARFDSKEEMEAAMVKDREHLGSRFVILSRMDESLNKAVSIKLSGMPFRSSESDVIEWFSPKAPCTKVRLLKTRDGRPRGEAIAEFATKEEATQAMTLNKEYLGDRFVILTPLNF